MIEIKYHKDVLLFLDELSDILIDKEYFSFYEYSAQYIEDFVLYVNRNIFLLHHKKTPVYFSKYGNNLITNNHIAESNYFNM